MNSAIINTLFSHKVMHNGGLSKTSHSKFSYTGFFFLCCLVISSVCSQCSNLENKVLSLKLEFPFDILKKKIDVTTAQIFTFVTLHKNKAGFDSLRQIISS